MKTLNVNTIQIGNYILGDNHPCFIIAEAGSNHNGDIEQAKKLVDIAAEAGVNAVKFQTFTGDKLFAKSHPGHKVIQKYEFKLEWHREIQTYCERRNILFLTTPFQKDAVDVLEELNIAGYKIASGDLDYYPLLDYVAQTGKPVILATGMAYLDEVREAVQRIRSGKTRDITLLHCTSNYPPEDKNINLQAMITLKEEFHTVVGLSDHSSGITMPVAAVAMGANIIEKHFTLSRTLEGLDHFYALEPRELKQMVGEIRRVEKAMGAGRKIPVPEEYAERHYARRGIIATCDLKKGEAITEKHLTYVRPVNGIESKYYQEIIGKTLTKDIKQDEPLRWEHFS